MRSEDATHAYIGVYDGIVKVIRVDTADKSTAEDVADVIRTGGTVDRVPIALARTLIFEPWPRPTLAPSAEPVR